MESPEFSHSDTIAILTRTPAALDVLLRGLPPVWVSRNEGDRTWTAFDIVGHLACLERTDWIRRVRAVLDNAAGDPASFEPVDRFAQLKENQGKSLEQLLDDFARLRADNLAALREMKIQSSDLTRRGRHPALGAVTLAELFATWAVHDLNHLHQLSRVMAHQCRDAVGPWKAYMGVLHCDGHGAP